MASGPRLPWLVPFLLAVSACHTWAPELAECPTAGLAPPAAGQCLDTPEVRSYLRPFLMRYAERLSTRRTREGAARLVLGFADGSAEGRVCLKEASGQGMPDRVRLAAATFRNMPPAPQCLAGRRGELDWSSALVTHEHVERAEKECAEEHGDHLRIRAFCRLQANCGSSELRRLQTLQRRDLSACRLRKVPISVQLDGGRQTVYFQPGDFHSPAAEDAQAAMRACDDASDHADLTACMRARGWKMVATETRSDWLLD